MGPGALKEILAGISGARQSGAGGNLIVGFDSMDDAAVFRMDNGTLLVQTLDFFTPVVDDPYTFGQIAAVNALSDIYAMGGRPLMAGNILCFPACGLEPQTVADILRGGLDKVVEAGAVLAGGHSVDDEVPKYGLSVIGTVQEAQLTTNSGGRAGDLLYLSKPLGTGALLTALKAGLIDEAGMAQCIAGMCTLNASAADIGRELQVQAATDVTGFGLAGHLHELAQASGLSAQVYGEALEFYPQALDFARQGMLPAGLYRNRDYLEAMSQISGGIKQERVDLMFDPQTSGGLLLCVAPEKQEQAQALLKARGMPSRCIGRLVPGDQGSLHVFVDMREAEIWR